MLTKYQKQVLDFIKSYISKNDYAPSLEEIKKHLKIASVSTAHFHIKNLQKAGYLKKIENQPRAIELNNNKKLLEIPLVGTITAGQPIEAIEDSKEVITISDDVRNPEKLFALKVLGNSMIGEGIFDGDTVVIRQQSIADDGQMVVAIIDDNEATLKKIYREKNRFRLQPANPTLFPFYRKEVEVRGIVVKIIRNLESRPESRVLGTGEKENTSDDKYKRRIDYSWDFNGEKTKSHTHGIHTYPAMFIPQVARRLLQKYSKKNGTVCDIFCGSGTALVESRLLGRNSYGIDLNPLAIFLAKAKTTQIEPKLLQKEYFKLIDEIKKIKDKNIQRPVFLNIDFWFKDKVIIELAKIKKAIKEIKNEKIKNFFMVAFSETVRLVSNTKNGEFKLVRIKPDKLKDFSPNVLEIFKKKTENNISGMAKYYKDVNKKSWTKIIYGDSSKDNGIKNNSIDFILTSPPYGDSRTTVAYGQFSRLSAQWIDIFDEPNKASGVDKDLLGGKATKDLQHKLESGYLKESLNKIAKKDEKRAKDVLSFYLGLNDCL
ncbi:MAG: transcriptional repressor LexA, partial [Candidatus Kuenenbacteria bacterium]